MNSILFFAMILGLAAGVICLGLGRLCGLREGHERLVFFGGCLLGFWGANVALMADDVAQSFNELQDGLEHTVDNSLVQHWQRMGRDGLAAFDPQPSRRLCTAEDLASPAALHCHLAVGVNSTSVCPGWMLYVPFFLPALKPCAALRTTGEVLGDAEARQVLIDAINQPCSYVPGSLDYAAKRMRRVLGCDSGQRLERVMLIVERAGEQKTLVLRPGNATLP